MLSGAQRIHDPTLLTERAKLHEIGKIITCCIINLFDPGYFVVEGFVVFFHSHMLMMYCFLAIHKCALIFSVSFYLSLERKKAAHVQGP